VSNPRASDVEIVDLSLKIELLIQKVDQQIEHVEQMEDRLKKLEVDYIRYRSFLGGVIFLMTAMWTFIVTSWDSLRHALRRLLG
jgi:hypothetical protein